MQEHLGISKGSASMTVRQLGQWGAVRKVWVKGDRKDYYEANDWLGQILRNVLADTIGKRLAQPNSFSLSDNDGELDDTGADADFIRSRLEHLQDFKARALKVWSNPLVKKLVG
jgi:DNA-binding transcriptional regulator GbsR (MarR family)